MVQSDDEADLEMMSAVLKFLNSLATASAVRPSLSSSSESAPDCNICFQKDLFKGIVSRDE